MPRIKKHSRSQDNQRQGNGWLVTFNDMITLLMVFFVLLFTMGSLDVKRFKNFQNGLQSALGIMHEGQRAPVGVVTSEEKNQDQQIKTPASDEAPVENNDELQGLDQHPGIEAEYTQRGIQLTLRDNLLFTSGSARITSQGRRLLSRVSKVIKSLGRNIRVEGHTDNIPIATSRYPSNWELSTARAVNVVKYLIDRGGIAPVFLSAAGYAESKPRAGNDTAANRAKNRRVDIILEVVSKPSIGSKVKAGRGVQPQEYIKYFED